MTLDSYLIARKLTNIAFARLVGVDASIVSRIRRGLQDPSLETMRRISDATRAEVAPNDFLIPARKAPTYARP